MPDNIILIGFMGSGKTTMGIRLSYRLRQTFLDTDRLIEKEENRSITDIFAADGEEYFRKKETEMLEQLLKETSGQVISVGGGTPLREKNRELLHKLGKVIYLKVSPETVYERLKGDNTRPLLQGENPMEKIKALLQERNGIYEETADVIICGDGKDCQQILDEMMEVCK